MNFYEVKIEPRTCGLFEPLSWVLSMHSKSSAVDFAFELFQELYSGFSRRMIKITVSKI